MEDEFEGECRMYYPQCRTCVVKIAPSGIPKTVLRAAGVRVPNDFPSPWKFAAAASTLSCSIVGDIVRSTLRFQARISSSLALLADSVWWGVFISMSMMYLMWRECGLRSQQFSQGFRPFRNGRPFVDKAGREECLFTMHAVTPLPIAACHFWKRRRKLPRVVSINRNYTLIC